MVCTESDVIDVSDEEIGICGGSITLDVSSQQKSNPSANLSKFWTQLQPLPWVRPNVRLRETNLRPIVIDGSNVSYQNGIFSGKRLEICIRAFQNAGHEVKAFMPQFRTMHSLTRFAEILDELVDGGDLILTPSHSVDGRMLTPYDDRYIVEYADIVGAVIVSRDRFQDLLKENPSLENTIKRTLRFRWIDDQIFFPIHPSSSGGEISLNDFLRF
ncbi:Zc3h12a-like Ribonuclease NYN domain [Nesidiocoris tenuis]|uniref:Zc3h12a-like Ribonuclease NYN domain n=1 Tax=Nesidiocoris tenuis TaxID=355587 RepID=A0ABN7B0X4_9HEMI|nr:Zc3h12a-like Ribonuclease NYN domain [Nesidiocoris tenuis]